MKKIFFLLSLFLFSGMFVFAEANLGSISVDFCNIPNVPLGHSRFAVEAGKVNPLCIQFHNEGNEDVDVSLGVVDGQLSNGGNMSCSASSTLFARYFSLSGTEFHLPAQHTLTTTGTLHFPAGLNGKIHVCFVYSLLNQKKDVFKKNTSMFDVVVRKVQFVDGMVVGSFSRGAQTDDVSYVYDASKKAVSLSLPVSTTGVIDENFIWSGTISNHLGYKRSFMKEGTVAGFSGTVVSYVFDDIPWYLGGYRIESQISFLPPTQFDVSDIPAKLLTIQIFPVELSFFIVSWQVFVGVVLLLLVLFGLRKFLRR